MTKIAAIYARGSGRRSPASPPPCARTPASTPTACRLNESSRKTYEFAGSRAKLGVREHLDTRYEDVCFCRPS